MYQLVHKQVYYIRMNFRVLQHLMLNVMCKYIYKIMYFGALWSLTLCCGSEFMIIIEYLMVLILKSCFINAVGACVNTSSDESRQSCVVENI